MTTAGHVYATVKSHPLTGDAKPEPAALEDMRKRSVQWPSARWAASQCVDLGSPNIGRLRFFAVGPENTVNSVMQDRPLHWSEYFVGFVNLQTGLIEPYAP